MESKQTDALFKLIFQFMELLRSFLFHIYGHFTDFFFHIMAFINCDYYSVMLERAKVTVLSII